MNVRASPNDADTDEAFQRRWQSTVMDACLAVLPSQWPPDLIARVDAMRAEDSARVSKGLAPVIPGWKAAQRAIDLRLQAAGPSAHPPSALVVPELDVTPSSQAVPPSALDKPGPLPAEPSPGALTVLAPSPRAAVADRDAKGPERSPAADDDIPQRLGPPSLLTHSARVPDNTTVSAPTSADLAAAHVTVPRKNVPDAQPIGDSAAGLVDPLAPARSDSDVHGAQTVLRSSLMEGASLLFERPALVPTKRAQSTGHDEHERAASKRPRRLPALDSRTTEISGNTPGEPVDRVPTFDTSRYTVTDKETGKTVPFGVIMDAARRILKEGQREKHDKAVQLRRRLDTALTEDPAVHFGRVVDAADSVA